MAKGTLLVGEEGGLEIWTRLIDATPYIRSIGTYHPPCMVVFMCASTGRSSMEARTIDQTLGSVWERVGENK